VAHDVELDAYSWGPTHLPMDLVNPAVDVHLGRGTVDARQVTQATTLLDLFHDVYKVAARGLVDKLVDHEAHAVGLSPRS
jgi:hypothetical protein